MKKTPALPTALLFLLLFSALANTLEFDTVQASTNVSGIIGSDTTWTKANSPYTLTGWVAVNSGVTLTIEPGVTVIGGSLLVNGTLVARGTNIDRINFGGWTQIIFTAISSGWNEQTGSGCIVKYSNLVYGGIEIDGSSPLISDNYINNQINYPVQGMGISIGGGSPIISNNNVTGILVSGGSPVISNNFISRGSNGGDYAAITIEGGSPVISNNNINPGTYSWNNGFMNFGSEIYPGIRGGTNVYIVGNTVSGCTTGINVNSGIIEGNSVYNNTDNGIIIGSGTVRSNTVFDNRGSGIEIDSGTVENNFVSNNTGAFGIGIKIGKGIVQNNTISNNYEGLVISSSTNIIYNNIQKNYWSVDLGSGITNKKNPNNINATNNWWGAIDSQAINQTIYDFKNDFTLGTVNFVPFLTELNPQAMPNTNSITLPTPTPSPTTTPTVSSTPTSSSTVTSTSTPNQSPSPLSTTTQSSTPSPNLNPTLAPSENPTPSPSTPQGEFSGTVTVIIIVITAIIAALSVALLLVLRRRKP
jgi:hypothetical protein